MTDPLSWEDFLYLGLCVLMALPLLIVAVKALLRWLGLKEPGAAHNVHGLSMFWRHWLRMLPFGYIAATVWAGLDVMAVYLDWWDFNEKWVLGPKIFGMPFEELLFFAVVPIPLTFMLYLLLRRDLREMPKWQQTVLDMLLWVGVATGIGTGFFYADEGLDRAALEGFWLAAVTCMTAAAQTLRKARAFRNWLFAAAALYLVLDGILNALQVVHHHSAGHTTGQWFLGLWPVENLMYAASLFITVVFPAGTYYLKRIKPRPWASPQ